MSLVSPLQLVDDMSKLPGLAGAATVADLLGVGPFTKTLLHSCSCGITHSSIEYTGHIELNTITIYKDIIDFIGREKVQVLQKHITRWCWASCVTGTLPAVTRG